MLLVFQLYLCLGVSLSLSGFDAVLTARAQSSERMMGLGRQVQQRDIPSILHLSFDIINFMHDTPRRDYIQLDLKTTLERPRQQFPESLFG